MAQPILLYSPIMDMVSEFFTRDLGFIPANEDSETWINTPGGSVHAGNAMIGALMFRKQQTGMNNNAIVMGQAASMGAVMLPFFDNVKAVDSATFMIHQASGLIENDEDRKMLIGINAKIKTRLESRIDHKAFNKITGSTFDEVFSMNFKRDVNLTAQEALEVKLINEVIKLDPQQIAAMANINFNNDDMGLKDMLNNRKPLITASAGDQTVAFREIKKDSDIEIVGSKDLFTGSFSHDNKEIEAKDGKILSIKDVSAKDKEIVALNEKIATMEASAKTQETETFEAMAMLLDKVEALEGTITAARMQKSDPVIPEKEFQEQGAAVPKMSARQKMKNKIAADNKGGNA